MRPTDRLVAAAFVVLWSSGFIGAELATRYASALTVLNWRFLLLAAPALVWLARRRSRLARPDVAVCALVGLLGQVGYLYGVVAASEAGVEPGTTALVASLQPAVTAAAAFLVLGERVRLWQIGGLAVGFAGVAVVVSAEYSLSGAALWAYLLPLGAMSSLVAATITERRARPRSLGAVDALAVQFLAAAAAFAALSGATGDFAPPASAGFWASVAMVTVVAGLGGYGAYWAVVRRSGATTAATLLYLTPPTTMLWAWLWFGSALSALMWVGLAVTAAGVAMVLRRPAGRGPGPVGRDPVRSVPAGRAAPERAA